MISTISRRYSLDEYRAIKEKAEGRSEYRDVRFATTHPTLGMRSHYDCGHTSNTSCER